MKEKILENYFDSKTYTDQEIMQSIEKTKKEFAKKITNISIDLNDSGVYIVTYYFKNKESLWQKIIVKLIIYLYNINRFYIMEEIHELQ